MFPNDNQIIDESTGTSEQFKADNMGNEGYFDRNN